MLLLFNSSQQHQSFPRILTTVLNYLLTSVIFLPCVFLSWPSSRVAFSRLFVKCLAVLTHFTLRKRQWKGRTCLSLPEAFWLKPPFWRSGRGAIVALRTPGGKFIVAVATSPAVFLISETIRFYFRRAPPSHFPLFFWGRWKSLWVDISSYLHLEYISEANLLSQFSFPQSGTLLGDSARNIDALLSCNPLSAFSDLLLSGICFLHQLFAMS